MATPSIEVVADGDGARGTVARTDRPVLVEGLCSVDGRLVDTLGTVEVVGGAIRGGGTEEARSSAGIVVTEGFDDVVLDEGTASPSVDGEITVSIGPVVCSIGNGTSRTGVPSLSAYKVTLVAGPLDTVLATSTVGIGNGSSTISPEGVVVSSTGTGAAGSGTSKDLAVVTGDGKDSCNKGRGRDDE